MSCGVSLGHDAWKQCWYNSPLTEPYAEPGGLFCPEHLQIDLGLPAGAEVVGTYSLTRSERPILSVVLVEIPLSWHSFFTVVPFCRAILPSVSPLRTFTTLISPPAPPLVLAF